VEQCVCGVWMAEWCAGQAANVDARSWPARMCASRAAGAAGAWARMCARVCRRRRHAACLCSGRRAACGSRQQQEPAAVCCMPPHPTPARPYAPSVPVAALLSQVCAPYCTSSATAVEAACFQCTTSEPPVYTTQDVFNQLLVAGSGVQGLARCLAAGKGTRHTAVVRDQKAFCAAALMATVFVCRSSSSSSSSSTGHSVAPSDARADMLLLLLLLLLLLRHTNTVAINAAAQNAF
jgi:hypothetical protein